jgi:hypothetical protein
LGKGPQALVWAENIVRKTNRPVLILTPLTVASQFVREGDKFDIEVKRTKEGTIHKGINVTNYQRLHYYDPSKLAGVVADESSILKHMDAKTRKAVTEFMAKVEYRLLCTATPAPNDFMELGGSSEALGNMTRNQMLAMFFVNDGETTQQWRLKGHAQYLFWRWVASWARAIRKPSDLGFQDKKFKLPPLNVLPHQVVSDGKSGKGFIYVANTLEEQREERRSSLHRRCEKVVDVLPTDRTTLSWCQLNDEGDLLTRLIPGAVQVKGSDSDDEKEEKLGAFASGKIRALVTKPSIASFGLNLQCCADVSYFPTHSQESYYQAVRRCWRFGQDKEVNCHLVFSQAEMRVVNSMLRKERQSVELYDGVIRQMNEVLKMNENGQDKSIEMELPTWLSNGKK